MPPSVLSAYGLLAINIFQDPLLDLLIPLAFGGGILALAVGMYRMEVHREPLIAKAESDSDALHLKAMIRRRKQVAILIGLLGLLLTLCNSRLPWARFPPLTTIYLLALLILVVWILLLTMGDFMANRVYLTLKLGDIHQRQREMEQVLSHKQKEKSHPPTPVSPPKPASGEATLNQMRLADQAGHDPELN